MDFLRTELEAALAFTGRAFATRDDGTRERNRKNARQGYDVFMRIMRTASFEPAEAEQLLKPVERLRAELQKLGETFECPSPYPGKVSFKC